MVRSFHYAAYTSLLDRERGASVRPEDVEQLDRWARFWTHWASATFLRSYLEAAVGADFLPAERDALRVLLDVYLLDKAVYELGYEMNNRPEWIWVPVQGIRTIMGGAG
jgi:maltose alpha-D-glucosyltransferase / alpha-amylase